ncbi:glycosyltransferase family 2 protein [Butyrivibrio sp.]|uniref:glycosyltransferase family 2 protein n=1 Tax=Butyrivibrio sp. TaxID=28121 RepID=UPI0025C2C454|nr:glycosyltransferase [Butyrivibrio sp.]MBE5837313.1 glycosyltransferase [Butyrivibrio sp.]
MNKPLLSVIMPIYNSEKYLSQAIECVINQSYQNWELLLINDGSTDNSGSICSEYKSKDTRIRLLTQENQGSQIARNYGLKQASGELISFIDSDDLLDKDMFSIMIDNMLRFEADVSACEVGFDVNEYGLSTESCSFSAIVGNNNVIDSVVGGNSNVPRIYGYLWNKIYSKKILENVFFDKQINIGEDGLFNIKLLRNCNKVAYTSKKLYFYRQYGDSLTKTHTRSYTFWNNEVIAYTNVIKNDHYDKLQSYCKQMLVFCYLKKAEAIIREKRDLRELYSDKKELKKLGKVKIYDKNAAALSFTFSHCTIVFIIFKLIYLKSKKYM